MWCGPAAADEDASGDDPAAGDDDDAIAWAARAGGDEGCATRLAPGALVSGAALSLDGAGAIFGEVDVAADERRED